MATTMPAPTRTSLLRRASAIADARVEIRVDEVDDQVRDQEQPADDEDRALHEGVVTLEHRPQEQAPDAGRSEEHTSELQSLTNLVCRLLLEKKKKKKKEQQH